MQGDAQRDVRAAKLGQPEKERRNNRRSFGFSTIFDNQEIKEYNTIFIRDNYE